MQFHFYDPLQGSTAARGQLAESLGSDSGDMSVTDLGKTIYRVLSRVSRDYNVLSNDHEVVVRAKGQDLPRLVITDSGRNDGKVKLALEVMGRNPQVWTMDKRSPLKIVKEIRMAMDHLLKEDSPPYPPHLKGSRAARGEQRALEYERKLEAEGKKRRRSNRASTKGARVRRSEIHEGASPKKKQTRKDLGLVDDVQRAMKMAQRALIADKRGLYWKSLVSAKDTIQKALDTFNDGDTEDMAEGRTNEPGNDIRQLLRSSGKVMDMVMVLLDRHDKKHGTLKRIPGSTAKQIKHGGDTGGVRAAVRRYDSAAEAAGMLADPMSSILVASPRYKRMALSLRGLVAEISTEIQDLPAPLYDSLERKKILPRLASLQRELKDMASTWSESPHNLSRN